MPTSSKPEKKTFGTFIIWTLSGEGAPLAYKLQKEGKKVILAIVNDAKLAFSEEIPEEKKRRLEMMKGLVKTVTAEKLLPKLKDFKDKDDCFLFFDLNCLYTFSQACQKMGFKYGNFFQEQDYKLESDRELAKELVKKYYPGLKIAPVHEFKKVEDAVKFLEEEKGNFYALKGDSDHGAKTVVPKFDDVETCKRKIIENLQKDPKSYEAGGFILETRIPEPMELTPAAFFWNGELAFMDIDLENKEIGAGNIGYQVGAAQTLIMPLERGSQLAEIAFPEAAHKMAKKHLGMFNIDASILVDRRDNSMYFGEFCSRPGYDSLFVEMAMSRSASGFFEDIVNGINPLIREYGAGVRLFNLPKKAPYLYAGNDLKDKGVDFKTDSGLYFFDLKEENGEKKTCGYSSDAAVAVGYGKEPASAIGMAHENAELYGLDDVYYRPEKDFNGMYKTSIMERYEYVKAMAKSLEGVKPESK